MNLPAHTARVVAAAAEMMASPNDLATRQRFVRATFNLDALAAVITGLSAAPASDADPHTLTPLEAA